LAASPHLISAIREIFIENCDEQVLNTINRIPFSHLHTLVICGNGSDPLSNLQLKELILLFGLPTIRVVYLSSYRTASMWQILQHCNPALDTIHLIGGARFDTLPAQDVPLPLGFWRPRIAHLSLLNVKQALTSELLLTPSCPLDVSKLTHVRVSEPSARPGLFPLMMQARTTISSFHFYGSSASAPPSCFGDLEF
jgi:hypothetical protein